MDSPRTLLGIFAFLLAPVAWIGAATGDLDSLNLSVGGSFIKTTTVQPDGKMILTGTFASILNTNRTQIARVTANGILDANFDPRPDGSVTGVVVQGDGKIVLCGAFGSVQPNGTETPVNRQRLVRFHADGMLDDSFDPQPNGAVYSLAVQPDGKLLVAGFFTTLQAVTDRRRIARFNENGTLDSSFDPNPNDYVTCVAVQPDGKVLLGGVFTTLQPNGSAVPIARVRMARLYADGTADATFNPPAFTFIQSIAVQADGKILVGGAGGVARVNADGSSDMSFSPRANGFVYSVALQADGKVLFGGEFTSVQPNGAPTPLARNYLARVHADGELDTDFDPRPDRFVYSSVLQADGKVLLGGAFTRLQPNGAGPATFRYQFARLQNDPAPQALTAPDPTQVVWTRSGAAPEVTHVLFDVKVAGGSTWIPLGAGARVGTTANWQLAGLGLPSKGSLRARGIMTGGYASSGGGWFQQIAAFDTTPYGQWKLTELGDANATDAGNTDMDAFQNLAEYGLVLSPTAFSAGPLSERFSYPEGDRLRIVFTRDPARNDVTIEVLAADDLSGPWTPIASSVLGGVTTGAGYYGGDSAGPGLKTVEVRDLYKVDDPAHPRRFLRLRVSR